MVSTTPIRSRGIASLFLALALGTIACGDQDAGADRPSLEVAPIDCPAPATSGRPNLFASRNRIYLSWIERPEEGPKALRFAVLEDGRWGSVRTVVERADLLSNWADFPSMAELPGESRLVAHWLVRRPAEGFAYDIAFSSSADGGATWETPETPHRDGTLTEHGFVSLVPGPRGQVGAIWLDGREMSDGSGRMKLIYSVWDGRSFGPEIVLDDDVCTCCQTSAVATADRILVAYRDRTEGDVRDIKVISGGESGWSAPVALHDDNWIVNFCPVNGPALASFGGVNAVAWFTAAEGRRRALFAFLDENGVRRTDPVRFDDGEPEGRVDVAVLADGSAVVSWLERREDYSEVLVRRVLADATALPAVPVARVASGRETGFPRIARSDQALYVTWTEVGPPSRVRLARIQEDRETPRW